MKKLAVLISNKGTGTNLQAIVDAIKNHQINAQISAVVSDTPEALGLNRARKNKIPIKISKRKEDLLAILLKLDPDYVCLAGWKQIVTDEVIGTYKNRILNTHPGLIPDQIDGVVKNPDGTRALWNKGKLTDKAMQNFLDNNATYAGCSNHFLTHQFDFGPVLGRCFEKIRKNDTVDSLYTRLKVKENRLYVDVLSKLCKATVLVIDGGGRGSTLVDKYLQSPQVEKVLAVPGNDMMKIGQNVEIFPSVKTTDVKNILKIAKSENVDLIDVAQDDAVAAGLTDVLIKNGFRVFGPIKAAGQIEWDKAWSRNFMKKNNIPAPAFKICKSELEGNKFINSQKNSEWFIKASGLAAGKGAIYAKNNKEAQKAILAMKSFGKSGETFLIEECLHGEEFSSFAIVDGRDFVIVGHAQDHKRVFDGDLGPNTGGMGCSSPPMAITSKVKKQIKSIFQKTVSGLVKTGRKYRGVLYLGGMIDRNGKVFVIEFNARWGDPEAQVIIPSIKNDLYELEEQILAGNLNKLKLDLDSEYRIAVTASSKGYPDDYSKVIGKEIKGLEPLLRHPELARTDKGSVSGSIKIYGAGVKVQNKKYIASGGRLFYVMTEGKNIVEAREKAYNALSKIKIEDGLLHYRKDIGYRDFERMRNPERSRRIDRLKNDKHN